MAPVSQVADCIFCKIVSGEAPCFRVCEDDHTLVFLDLFPVAAGHTLVVTRNHYENLFEATPAALEGVARSAKRVAGAIRKALAPDGLGVYQLNGAAAGQTVFHYHMHLVPRARGDALTLHGRTRGDEAELRAMAARLSAALSGG
jgi:histidine triad (HIT) family protein